MLLPLVNLRDVRLSADLLPLFMGAFRYMEHSQLQIPKALPPVAEEISSAALAAAALASSSTPAVSDKEWKTLLGKLVSCLFSDMQHLCFQARMSDESQLAPHPRL